MCTDTDCAKEKNLAWGERLKKEAGARGQKVLSPEQWQRARYGNEYIELDDTCHSTTDACGKSWRSLVEVKREKLDGAPVKMIPEGILPVLADTGDGVIELLPKEEAVRLAKANGAKFYESHSGGSSDGYRKQQAAARKAAQLQEKIWCAVTTELVEKCEAAKKPTLEFWRLLAGTLADDAWNDGIDRIAKRRGLSQRMMDSRPAMVKAVESMTPEQCVAFLFEVLVLRGIRGEYGLAKPQKVALAMFGVNEAKITAQFRAEALAKAKGKSKAKDRKAELEPRKKPSSSKATKGRRKKQ